VGGGEGEGPWRGGSNKKFQRDLGFENQEEEEGQAMNAMDRIGRRRCLCGFWRRRRV
jgi:hypothetical protein